MQSCNELVLFHLHPNLCWWIWCCGAKHRSYWGRKFSLSVSPPVLWPCPWSLSFAPDAIRISRSLSQGSFCFRGRSYLWASLSYPLLGKCIILWLLLTSQKLSVPSVTLLCPLLLLHILPMSSPRSWGSLQHPLQAAANSKPGTRAAALCPVLKQGRGSY